MRFLFSLSLLGILLAFSAGCGKDPTKPPDTNPPKDKPGVGTAPAPPKPPQ